MSYEGNVFAGEEGRQQLGRGADDPGKALDVAMEIAARFFHTLFVESDTVLIRPIETWDENGRKRSRVDHGLTCYRQAIPMSFQPTLSHLLRRSESERLNLYFGVCPREGHKGRFDLAWQIRTVRCLWSDIDHISVDDTRERVAKAGLPVPSLIVNSGNGAHVYWLLNAPYSIDDVGAPPPVLTEWTESSAGRKSSRKYIIESGERLYLDQHRYISRISPKAAHIQDVLAGIAKSIGGDHTTDLSRLLRIPGTFNRKDQRNGRQPVLTELVQCDATVRYPFSVFEPLKWVSPGSVREKQLSVMPLPAPRKISPKKSDELAELIAACSIAPAGSRSEADFAVCCYAIRSGIAKDELWSQVEQVGKFAEQGRRYFELTWDNAEYDARAATFDKLQKRAAAKGTAAPVQMVADGDDEGGAIPPSEDVEGEDAPGRPTIVVDAQNMPVADTLHQVTDRLLAAGNCFLRSDQLVVIHQEQISTIISTPELAGLLNEHVEFYFVEDETGQYKPLPSVYANTWLNQRTERSRLLSIKLFTRNPVYTDDWRLVAPGFDPESGIYYAGPPVAPRAGTGHLDNLLRDFCFLAPGDRTNYLGVLLTAMLIPRFVGSKPAVLFSGNQPELGKSILAQIIAILRDGQPAETASYNPNDEEFEKRLGAIVRGGATTIIIDNAKAQSRNPRIDSACLERSITDPILSFRLLGKSVSIRAENSHIFCLTANTPDVSRDLVTRSLVINLFHEGDPERRKFSIADPEGYAQQHRLELLGELIGMVERWKASAMPMANVHSRFNKRGWGNVVGGILQACGEPDFLANAQEAAFQLDETRREFTEVVGLLLDHPKGKWSAAELVEFCGRRGLLATDLGEGSARSLATKMGTLAGRFVGERFSHADGREAIFHKKIERKGTVYRVSATESAEP